MVFKYTEALALDLRVFAKHGKRAVVGLDDVKCVARKDAKMVCVCACMYARACVVCARVISSLVSTALNS